MRFLWSNCFQDSRLVRLFLRHWQQLGLYACDWDNESIRWPNLHRMPFRKEAKVIQCNEGRFKAFTVVTNFQATVGIVEKEPIRFWSFRSWKRIGARLQSSCTGWSRNCQLVLIYWAITGLWGMGSFLLNANLWFVFVHRDMPTSPAQDANVAGIGSMRRKIHLSNLPSNRYIT